MKFYDIFNGDADGICALHQLRLSEPLESVLVSGVKRDISLLKKVHPGEGDQVTVLDISLDANRAELLAMLERGATVRYFDHHFAGDIPAHPRLDAQIDTSAEICTSLMVDRHLNGAHRAWAIAAAFGDNLHDAAMATAANLGLDKTQLGALREVGECLNYNAYGNSPADLHYDPVDLYLRLRPFVHPLDFYARAPEMAVLRAGLAGDLEKARQLPRRELGKYSLLVLLPDTDWSRRISGVLGNELARENPDRVVALLGRTAGGYRVSLRGPERANVLGIARLFDSGGGRGRAAGISFLPNHSLPDFIAQLERGWEP
ncbi:MAG: acetyltransferase [Burkholderiales bacterium]